MSNGKTDLLQDYWQQQAPLLDSVPVQMWFLSADGTYGRANQRHADFLGVSRSDLEFRPLRDRWPADVASVCEQSTRAALAAGATIVTQEWMPDAQGVRRLMEITKTPTTIGNGDASYVVCAAVEVASTDDNFRALVESISDIVLIGDFDGRVMYSNPATTEALGYSADELLGMRILDLHPEFVREEAAKILGEMFAGARVACPLPLSHKSGALVPVETRVWMGRWNGVDCIVGLCREISHEQEALQKFDRLFRMNPAPMAVSNIPEQVFIEVNEAWMRTLGYTEAEVIGKRAPDLNLFVDHDEQLRVANILRETGSVRDEELRVRAKSGRILVGLFSGEIIENQGKTYFLTVMNDITARKLAEAERHETIRELRAALGEIRDLQGILPICASCKKVRDDTGYWEQVESYVARHTGAQFSHGVCPDCIKALYPDFSRPRSSD